MKWNEYLDFRRMDHIQRMWKRAGWRRRGQTVPVRLERNGRERSLPVDFVETVVGAHRFQNILSALAQIVQTARSTPLRWRPCRSETFFFIWTLKIIHSLIPKRPRDAENGSTYSKTKFSKLNSKIQLWMALQSNNSSYAHQLVHGKLNGNKNSKRIEKCNEKFVKPNE